MDTTERATTVAAAAKSVFLPDVLLVEDLADVMRVTPAAVRALIRQGTIPGRKLGKRWLISRIEFLRSLTPPAATFRVVSP